MPNPVYRTATPAGWAPIELHDPEPVLVMPDEWPDFVPATDWADLPVYADPAPPIRSRPSRPDENFVPTPPAYNFESDPRNTYDH